MKINSIILENFGSYEGRTEFNTREDGDKNIILIGGKNGTGKTTLFTAMRLCLYGFMSMGYKSANAYYFRAIAKLINNSVKLAKPATAGVVMNIGISNGHELDEYILDRSWTMGETISEEYHVRKNGIPLDSNEIADFDKFLFSIIPPELFNLYFFDGEKIADFFLEEGGNTRIKGAFLTLCGYDTFDIMSKNFKRISSFKSGYSEGILNEYLIAKIRSQEAADLYLQKKSELEQCLIEIKNCEAELKELEQSYSNSGGISHEEWNGYLNELKSEEKKREANNAWIKRIANEYLPFLIIKKQVLQVQEQLMRESYNRKYTDFCEVLESPAVKYAVCELGGISAVEELKALAYANFGNNSRHILDLSFESSASVLSSIKKIIEFDEEEIIKAKKSIKTSISRSSKIRKILDECTIDSVQVYMQRKNALLQTKNQLLAEQIELSEVLQEREFSKMENETALEKAKAILTEELKKESISDISSRAILMLDKLQSILYHKQIEKIENYFRKEINLLMRKTKFIDDIRIDDRFNIHIYRHEKLYSEQLIKILSSNKESIYDNFVISEAYKQMQEICGCKHVPGIIHYLKEHIDLEWCLPVEIDKTSLSNGEKQIFIMALYHSLVQLCNHEVPFVIDTPFARIDTEHRQNISKHFFSKLNGQVFILSTNEEINAKHIGVMKDRIAVTYMLENSDNKRTTVLKNAYFEE